MAADASLLTAWREGDDVAGRQLVERYLDGVHWFFRNKVDGDVEDLIQRTFLACVESRDRVESAASFRAYLFTVARNELFKHYRRRGRSRRHDDLGATSVADLVPSASKVIAHRQEQRLLLRALRDLPLDLQVAVELCYWENLDSFELSDVLGVPPSTVRSRLSRARELLRARISELAASEPALKTTTDNLDRWARAVAGTLRDEAALT